MMVPKLTIPYPHSPAKRSALDTAANVVGWSLAVIAGCMAVAAIIAVGAIAKSVAS